MCWVVGNSKELPWGGNPNQEGFVAEGPGSSGGQRLAMSQQHALEARIGKGAQESIVHSQQEEGGDLSSAVPWGSCVCVQCWAPRCRAGRGYLQHRAAQMAGIWGTARSEGCGAVQPSEERAERGSHHCV